MLTSETNIDQLLSRAAAPERASHVDPAFVARVEQQLNATPRLSLLGLLPAIAVLLAAILALPVLLGAPMNWGGLWDWLSEPLGLQLAVETLAGLDSREGAAIALWPYMLGLLAVLVPLWVPASDL